MSLFRPLWGDSSRIDLETTPFHAGYCYLTTDDGKFYIDAVDSSNVQRRILINDDTKYAGRVIYGTLTAAGWTNATQNVNFTGVTTTTSFVWTGLSDQITAAQSDAAAAAQLRATTQGNGYITFVADGTVPTIDIPVMAVIPNIVQLEATASSISYTNTTSGLTATNAQAAIDELAARPVAGDAEDIDYDNTTSGLTATDVQAAIDELADKPDVNLTILGHTLRVDGSDITVAEHSIIYNL